MADDCPAPDDIDAFVTGRVGPAAAERIQTHVDVCTTCRVLIGKLAQESAAETPAFAATVAATVPATPETVGDSPVAAPHGPLARVDRYVIKRRLGAGGMGVVYVATDPELGRDVAIKVLRSGAQAERLRREAQALARLNHPNVVAVYDVGEHAGGVFVAMALVDGQNLREWLRTEHTTDEVLRVLLGAARGIIAAHRAGMIHRDLKPDNIFVANDGNVLVGDFGLARDAGSTDGATGASAIAADSLTMTGSVLGTPAYMPPEQAAGEASERSDQFSFCVTAYEALHGTRPFAGTTLEQVIANVEARELVPPARERDVPDPVHRAIVRGLSADPAHRFASMAELVAALAPRPRRRWPWVVAGVAALAGGTAVVAIASRHDDPAARCAPTRTLLAGVWNAQRAEQVVDKLVQHRTERHIATGLVDGLGRHAARWTTARHAACLDEATGRLTRDAAAAQVQCLAVNRQYLEQAIDTLASRSTFVDPAILWKEVAGLPSPEACRGVEAARLTVPGPEHLALMRDVARARSQYTALDVYASLRARAERANDAPAQLAIALAEADQALEGRTTDVAEAALARALALAETLDLPAARIRALAMSARLKCQQGGDASVLLDLADASSRRLREEHHALEIDSLLDARGTCAFKTGRYEDAAAAYDQLLDRLLARYGEDDPLQLETRGTLAVIYHHLGKPEEAARHSAVVQRVIADFGGDQNASAMATSLAAGNAFMAGDVATAIREMRRAADLWGDDNRPLKVQALEQLALYHEADGAWRASADVYSEIVTLLPDAQPDAKLELIRIRSITYRGAMRLNAGDLDGAAADLERALALVRGGEQLELLSVAQLGLGRVRAARREWRSAVEILREGLATYAKVGSSSALRVGLAELALAEAQWRLGDRTAARATARKAELDLAQAVTDVQQAPMAKNQLPWREARLAEAIRWRDEHR